MLSFLLLSCALALAFVNGANDNMKGVASLIGSRLLSFRSALLWANVTTFAGVAAAVFLYTGLAAAFSGQGIVPHEIANHQQFMVTAVSAAAATVFLATCVGLPVSTTHALVGGISGAGIAAAPANIAWHVVGDRFFLPLAVSPVLAALATIAFAAVIRAISARAVHGDACLCVSQSVPAEALPAGTMACIAAVPNTVGLQVGTSESCLDHSTGLSLPGVSVANFGNLLHICSAGAVCFARGLNDAPKIAAMSLVAFAVPSWTIFFVVAVAMTLGAVLQSRRVSMTMSERITAMPCGQALGANMVTAAIVILASRFGMPVSTTHVSCGALFGLGAATGTARWKTISGIIAAWLATLPMAAVFGFCFYRLLRFVM